MGIYIYIVYCTEINQWNWKHMVDLSTLFYKGYKIFHFLVAFLHTSPLLQNDLLLKLNLLSSGNNFFPFRLVSFSDGMQKHNVPTMSLQRRCNVVTLQRRCCDVVCLLGDAKTILTEFVIPTLQVIHSSWISLTRIFAPYIGRFTLRVTHLQNLPIEQ